jgi:hypothetical protein
VIVMPRYLLGVLAAVLLSVGVATATDPDPASVRRYGPAYRYPQAGWVVLHIEGEPFDRGYQHGRLMAPEITAYVRGLALLQSAKAPADGWRLTRTLIGSTFLRKFDREYLEEMRGIADGAAAAGATFDGRPIDILDIAAANVQVEYDTIDAALDAQPVGLEGVRFPRPPAPKCCPPAVKDHCSAFAATGPATKDGKMVIGHITMSGLYLALGTNVWLDVKPSKGYRVVMQSFPGGIWSGQDYYLNSAGIVLTETTIRQTQFNPDGTPVATRARRAMQYGSTIDDVVKELTTKNNGLYTNEWLIGDANTNEVAILELGTNAHRLRRSSKNEWLVPGAEGFYWGCNNTKDLAVRLDTYPSLTERPQNVTWRPSDRDKAWLRLYEKHRGKVDAEFGKLAFSTPPLAAHPSLDAKVTTTEMARRMETHAVFGPPYQKVWVPTFEERTNYPDIRPLIPNDWVVLTPAEPAKGAATEIADIADRVTELADKTDKHADPPTVPAWHGTLLPESDADVWLTAGFAEYERVVALENALREKSDTGSQSDEDRERVSLALFCYRSDYLSAKAARPNGKSPDGIAAMLDRDRWYREQVGYGVLALNALRQSLGAEKFTAAMGAFGRANAGKKVTAAGFAEFVGKQTDTDVAGFLKRWEDGQRVMGVAYKVTDWLDHPEEAVIVYGTAADAAANEAAAKELEEAARVRWTNVSIPIKADKDVTDADLKGRHIVLIGRPAANAVAKRFAPSFPVTFGSTSAKVRDKLYAHEETAVVAATANPADGRYSVTVVAGLSAAATYRAVGDLMRLRGPAEVLVLPAAGRAKPLVVHSTALAGTPPKDRGH